MEEIFVELFASWPLLRLDDAFKPADKGRISNNTAIEIALMQGIKMRLNGFLSSFDLSLNLIDIIVHY